MTSIDLAIEVICNPYKELLESDMCMYLMKRRELNEDDRQFKKALDELLEGNSSEAVFTRYCSDYEPINGITQETLKQDLIDFSIMVRTEKIRDKMQWCVDNCDWQGYNEACRAITDIANSYNDMEVFSMKKYVGGELVETVKAKENDTSFILSTGFKEIDNAIGGGFQREAEVMGILAQSNTGKSWMLHAICNNLNANGEKVGLYSPEMPCERVVERFATLQSHVSNVSITKGRDVDYEKLERAQSQLSRRVEDIEITEAKHFGGQDPTVTQLRQWCVNNNLTVLAIDGISYIRGRGETDWKKQSNVAQELMNLSTELKIPVIFVVQASRTKKGEDFDGNSSTAGSKDIYNKCTISFKLTASPCDDYENYTKLIVTVDKNRYGGGKNIDIEYKWLIDTGEFSKLETATEPTVKQQLQQKRQEASDVF